MKQFFTQSKISRAILFSICIFFIQSNVKGQVGTTDIFYQDFTLPPVDNLFNSGDTVLLYGVPPCGYATWADAFDFNSANCNFAELVNLSSFMAVAPEVLCGGFYTSIVSSDTFDCTGMDSVQFLCRYYRTNTLGWGATTMSVIFDNGSTTHTVQSEFTAMNTWTYLAVTLPASMEAPQVSMRFNMGGGEGVAFDDVIVRGYFNNASIEDPLSVKDITLYPNPTADYLTINSNDKTVSHISIMDLTGKVVYQNTVTINGTSNIQVSEYANGLYMARITDDQGNIQVKRFVVKH